MLSVAGLAGVAAAQTHDLRSAWNGATPNSLGQDQPRRDMVGPAGNQCQTGCFELVHQNPNAVNGFFSDCVCALCGASQVIADDFKILAQTDLCEVVYWGGYYPNNTLPTDDITITLYADAGGFPGAQIHQSVNPATTRVATGNVLFGVNEYMYTSTLTSTVNLAIGSYWIAIENTVPGSDDWFWETGDQDAQTGGPNTSWDTICPPSFPNQFGNSQSMILCGTVPPPPPPPVCTGSGCTEEVVSQIDNAVNGYFSDVSCDICGGGSQSIADNFTVSQATSICEFKVMGGFFPANVPVPDDITIIFHSDAGGLPGAAIYTETNVALTRVQTGDVLFGVNEWEYTFNMSPGPGTLAPGTYWVEIFNDTGLGTDDWFWETGSGGTGSVGGSAFAFETPGVTWNFGGDNFSLKFCGGSEFATKYCVANNNSTGAPADLAASGSNSSSAGDLTLTSAPVPNQNSIFFHAANQAQLPFGNGFLCATGNIIRGAVVTASGNSASYTYDNSNSKHSLSGFIGQTRNFQHWFRDPMGGGAFFNTSNALTIPILP